ncbi:hypothetical protein TorRG33x02_334540 [Trema orientale]|uniref:Uncharacterized protein n=1 Tax=Trema orientale TaxID=63057 RepID=A0A2P5B2G2_TREOI|nr:hypothetical protein TorRG33x02_334540 [Trema orientale]
MEVLKLDDDATSGTRFVIIIASDLTKVTGVGKHVGRLGRRIIPLQMDIRVIMSQIGSKVAYNLVYPFHPLAT